MPPNEGVNHVGCHLIASRPIGALGPRDQCAATEGQRAMTHTFTANPRYDPMPAA